MSGRIIDQIYQLGRNVLCEVGRQCYKIGRRTGFHGNGRIADAGDARRQDHFVNQRNECLFLCRRV